MTKYVASWLARAGEDLQVAELLLQESRSANTICFHAQQAAEKYLKGFLAHHGEHVRKIHELDVLTAQCTIIDPSCASLQDDAVFLNQFYTDARYPDDMREFTMAEARKAYEAARRIETSMIKRF